MIFDCYAKVLYEQALESILKLLLNLQELTIVCILVFVHLVLSYCLVITQLTRMAGNEKHILLAHEILVFMAYANTPCL